MCNFHKTYFGGFVYGPISYGTALWISWSVLIIDLIHYLLLRFSNATQITRVRFTKLYFHLFLSWKVHSKLKVHLDKHCNFYPCKVEQVLSCSDSYTLELSLLPLKACLKSPLESRAASDLQTWWISPQLLKNPYLLLNQTSLIGLYESVLTPSCNFCLFQISYE